jgi:CysZ protein
VSEQAVASVPRPGVLRRAAAGAWHVPAGFAFLLKNPSLWLLALLPSLLLALFLGSGLLLAAFAGSFVEGVLAPARNGLPSSLGFVTTLLLWISTLGAGMLLGLAVALFFAGPLLDRLSRRVESKLGKGAGDEVPGLPSEFFASLRASLYFLVTAAGAFLLGLIPLAGPVLATLWGAHALALRLTEVPLGRRGLGFRARRAWHRDWWAESLGFGLAGLISLVVPLVNLLLGPALTVGGTLLVVDLQALTPPPPETAS